MNDICQHSKSLDRTRLVVAILPASISYPVRDASFQFGVKLRSNEAFKMARRIDEIPVIVMLYEKSSVVDHGIEKSVFVESPYEF